MMTSILKDSVMRLYRAGQLTDEGLNNAVEKSWISAEEAEVLKKEASAEDS